MYKIPKKGIFVREAIYGNTKTETYFLKKNLCHRNKFPSQKQLSSEFLSEKHTSVTENFLHNKIFFARDKSFCKRKKASVTEAS